MTIYSGPSGVQIDDVATRTYAHLFDALADPTRLAIVQHLSGGRHRVRDLVDHLGFAQSTVSKHLSFLAECGLVVVEPQGRASWYGLAEVELLAELIGVAERLLDAAGTKATLCSHLVRRTT